MSLITCPECESNDWRAVEECSYILKAQLIRGNNGVEIDIDPMSEFQKEMATSVITHYICSKCYRAVYSDELENL